jgi:hypothetical protein
VERDLFQKGFHNTARLHRKRIIECFWALPEVPLDSPVIGFKRPSVSHRGSPLLQGAAKKKRWSENLQCWEYFAPALIGKTKIFRIPTDEEAYLKWLSVGGVDSREIEDSIDISKIVNRWMPESAFGVKHKPFHLIGTRMFREYQPIPNSIC